MPDAQAAHEKTLTGMMAALAGANIIYGLGMLELGMTMDYAQLVMDNEFALMIKRTVGGFEVNDEELAVDVIKKVGPAGEFFSQKHTYSNFKRIQSTTELIDRRMRGSWEEDGAKDLTERAYAKAIDLLENHKPDPLPGSVAETLRDIVKDAEGRAAARQK